MNRYQAHPQKVRPLKRNDRRQPIEEWSEFAKSALVLALCVGAILAALVYLWSLS